MLRETVDLEMVKWRLYEKLKPSGWADKLKTLMFSRDIDNILRKLYHETDTYQRFTPTLKQVFRAFEQCPWNILRVVMIGQDPYCSLGVADGIMFSCSNTRKAEPELRYIFQEINETVYPHIKPNEYKPDADLARWANQGVLLFNAALTTRVGVIGAHYNIWESFTSFILSQISDLASHAIVFVFIGRKATEWSTLIGDRHYKLFVNHPVSGRYTQDKKWNSKNLFNEINRILFPIHGTGIQW